jgi:hypothetical protein
MKTMTTFIGTCYFVSKESATEYFKKEGNDDEAIQGYIDEGLIYIGSPPNIPEKSLYTDSGRYFIKEK